MGKSQSGKEGRRMQEGGGRAGRGVLPGHCCAARCSATRPLPNLALRRTENTAAPCPFHLRASLFPRLLSPPSTKAGSPMRYICGRRVFSAVEAPPLTTSHTFFSCLVLSPLFSSFRPARLLHVKRHGCVPIAQPLASIFVGSGSLRRRMPHSEGGCSLPTDVRGLLRTEVGLGGGKDRGKDASMFGEVFCFPKGQVPLDVPVDLRLFFCSWYCFSSEQESLALVAHLSPIANCQLCFLL